MGRPLHISICPSDTTKVPHTLLLADDSVTIQRVIELTFADEDIRVVAVSDGDQAIAAVDQNPPDIVLADVGMPGRTGYEVAQHIRSTPRLAHIPVLLLTGAFEPVDQARANAAGCDGVLAKPFEPQLVIGRVKELLARSRRAAEPAAAMSRPAAAADRPTPAPRSDSHWAPPLGEARGGPPLADAAFDDLRLPQKPTAPVVGDQLDDYFDRLDAAFSTLSNTPAGG